MSQIKQVLYFIIVFSFIQKGNAQSLSNQLSGTTHLTEVQSIAKQYFANKSYAKSLHVYDDNEYVKYKREEWFWKSRVAANGELPDKLAQYQVYTELQDVGQQKKYRSNNWRNISQTTTTGGYNGMGRLAAVAFHPSDTNIIYVGANKGGIWKTTTGGNNWVPLGDKLPFASVGNIVIDPINPSVIYITIGANEGWWQYGLGVYKSTDGGTNWSATANASNFNSAIVYYKLMMAPNNNQILYSAQSNGFFKSTDAGATWTNIYTGSYIDFEFKPNNPNTIYLVKNGGSTNNEIYKSTNAGSSFTAISNFASTGCNIEISVTPADSNYIAVGLETSSAKKFYLSTNGGSTFSLKNSAIDDIAIIQLSALSKNKVYCGYVSNHRSSNGGSNWTQFTNWYNDAVLPEVHADNHYAAINPLMPKYIYYCNDGGLYRYNETQDTWKDLSQGLIITEFYKLAHSQQDSIFIIGGTQDNGGRKRISAASWEATNGGDGMEVAVHPTNDATMYTTYWGGTLYRSYDKWNQDTYNEITPDSVKAAWVTPYLIDPNNDNRLVAGYSDVWISNDEGNNWNPISNLITGNVDDKLEILDVAPSNSNYIYTGRNNVIYYTTNLGNSWTNKNAPTVNGPFEGISCILVHPKNENTIYVTKEGYGNNSKVYKSTNNGSNWVNLTYNLPNVPINCILIDLLSDSSNMDIYIGTDVGVFYKKDSDVVWQYCGVGMPNTEVSDLAIFYPTGKLRAATYGRGIWESNIARAMFPAALEENTTSNYQIKLLQNPARNSLDVEITLNKAEALDLVIYDVNGRVCMQKNIQGNIGKQIVSLNIEKLNDAVYFASIKNKQTILKTLQWIKQ